MGEPAISYRAQWARQLVREKLAVELAQVDGLSQTLDPNNLPPETEKSATTEPIQQAHRICIIGAGVTGLYIAMILDSLAIPDLTYEILEGSDRAGGRLLTHYFSTKEHDYYDIGAMRFPRIPVMQRTFDLFEQLNIPLVPYYLSDGSVKCPTRYNDITVIAGGDDPKQPKNPDPFMVGIKNGGSVPDEYTDKIDALLTDAFGTFKAALGKDFKEGMKTLMPFDTYSTREFLKTAPKLPPFPDGKPAPLLKPLDYFTIQWLETNNTSSGLFDQAFSESVIDSFDFDSTVDGKPAEWRCINGGTSLVTKAMLGKLKSESVIQYKKRVKKIADCLNPDTKQHALSVTVAGETGPRDPYTTIFNTTSLACLQRVDLTGLTLHPSQKDAIRALHYDDSAKAAIKFSYPWWITECGITKGGAGYTDMPLRTCVYPSYNFDDPKIQPAVLLCSYTWAQDATRIGSLINNKASPQDEEELKELLLDNLAKLHLKNYNEQRQGAGLGPASHDDLFKVISDAYVEHNAYSWSRDPFTSGAFALFGPGQFSNLYPYLARPTANGRFHFCGEASSAHHAWIVGSLDSAVASVHRFLKRFCMTEHIEKMIGLWGSVPEVEDGPDGTMHCQIRLACLPQKLMQRV